MGSLGQKVRKVLIVDDERDIVEISVTALQYNGFEAVGYSDAHEALAAAKTGEFDVIVADIHMPHLDGIEFRRQLIAQHITTPMIFCTANVDPVIEESSAEVGVFEIITKPFYPDDLIAAVAAVIGSETQQIEQLMLAVHQEIGIVMTPDKRSVVESRLLRRMRKLNMDSIEAYFNYFTAHRSKEIKELVSVITTHTTEFFRIGGHFDYLFDKLFAQWLASGQQEIAIWSAACSSAEEVYSIVICWLEFLNIKGIKLNHAPRLAVLGTDIDFNVLALANEAVYSAERVKSIPGDLVAKYFDRGSGDLSGFYRVKDYVHKFAQFRHLNLVGQAYPNQEFDAVFLCNVLIYFKEDMTRVIVNRVASCLKPGGHLFLGTSESLSHTDLPFDYRSHSIYQLRPGVGLGSHVTTNPQMNYKATPVRKTRVLVIDDSATIRHILQNILAEDESIEVVAALENPTLIAGNVDLTTVDVITLDIHMPEQDGLSYLQSIQGMSHPPVVMISSVSHEDAPLYLKCLELGAIDYIEKPTRDNLGTLANYIQKVVKAAALHTPVAKEPPAPRPITVLDRNYLSDQRVRDLILIGSSTGGVEAIKEVLLAMPAAIPPILIVQHIPEHFSRTLAARLNDLVPFSVCEAADGDLILNNNVYIAPGSHHMGVKALKSGMRIELSAGPSVNRHKPSVDYLFGSVAELRTSLNIAAAILTGMGSDGAEKLALLRQQGAYTIAQNEASCVVYGMPGRAVALGAAVDIKPLTEIAHHLIKALCNRPSRAS